MSFGDSATRRLGERKEFELRLKLSDASRREEEARYHLFGDRGCSEVGGWDIHSFAPPK